MLDLNTVVSALDDDVAEATRSDIIEAVADACENAVGDSIQRAYRSNAVARGLQRWLTSCRTAELPAGKYSQASMAALLATLVRARGEAFSYSAQPNDAWRPGAPVDLEMHDRGGAIMHTRAYGWATILCLVLHREAGAEMVRRFDELHERNLRKIAELIGQRLAEKLRGR